MIDLLKLIPKKLSKWINTSDIHNVTRKTVKNFDYSVFKIYFQIPALTRTFFWLETLMFLEGKLSSELSEFSLRILAVWLWNNVDMIWERWGELAKLALIEVNVLSCLKLKGLDVWKSERRRVADRGETSGSEWVQSIKGPGT